MLVLRVVKGRGAVGLNLSHKEKKKISLYQNKVKSKIFETKK